ncbi:hypothetical protein [Streptomyces triticiradicis]|uniref:hypothetical protein n=1 Tax=Streptomyces triticiradicis TaxID=2651189 RepID=UPI001788E45B|nr:hypothetical protein [Streptomyces triticiradicis]
MTAARRVRAAALLLATAACGAEADTGTGAPGTSSPPASAPASAAPSPTAGGEPTASASKGSAPSPTASADGPVREDRSGTDLALLPGTRVTKGRAHLKVQVGTWTCPRPDAPSGTRSARGTRSASRRRPGSW